MKLFVRILLPFAAAAALSAATADRIAGTWLTPNGLSKVEIAKCGDRYCGSIQWMQNPKNDRNNADPTLRSRPLVGVKILDGFQFDGGASWSGGTIYAPERGKTVDAKLVLTGDDSLEVKVSAGMVKKTVGWTRVK